jgi:hypothetical protein
VVAQRDERVLQRRARARVRVDVARRHRAQPQPRGERSQPPVARPVVALEGALELDAQALGPEGVAQPLERRRVVDPVARAAAQAHETGGVLLERLERHHRRRLLRITRVGVRVRDDPAQVAPALLRLDQQREVTAVLQVHLRPVDRLHAGRLRRLGELHRAAQPVVVGQRERAVAVLRRGIDQLLGERRTVEERESGMGVELGVHRANTCSHGCRTDAG